ncbi:MAG: ATP-binding protein [Alphaproteobacteria bacterium]|nr:ATP-binding protein [Alphaproteobacteria bacterium]
MATTEPTGSFVEQALSNLVDQFARPLDLLRELAQNAMDAGTPRIDVWTRYDAPKDGDRLGVLRIGVDDHGEGMDERIIDEQLTRLFASSKEKDATKIGKFGIGFTSVFAIRPEAVLVRTGRHGESWELLFHADRSFDKIRLQDPVSGTSIVLFKRLPPTELDRWRREIRTVLGYWCEHSQTPITYEDRSGESRAQAEPDTEDPFAAFEEVEAGGPERVDRPMSLEGWEVHEHREEGMHVVVACPGAGEQSPPRFGFYNGGLTLLQTSTTEVLGPHADRLQHVSFKVKHDRLEHTLTRDNVLMDEHWARAMNAVVRSARGLRERLCERLVREVAADGEIEHGYRLLAAELRAGDKAFTESLAERPLFRTVTGDTVCPRQIDAQERRVGSVLVGRAVDALTEPLLRQGLVVLRDSPRAREVLDLLHRPAMLDWSSGRAIARAEQVFVVPNVLDAPSLDPSERGLVSATEELLRVAVGLRLRVPGTDHVFRWAPGADSVANRLTLRVGDFGGVDLGSADVLALDGPATADVFLRPRRGRGIRMPGFLTWRCLLANRHHATFRAHVLAFADQPDVAAFGLASALLVVEDVEGEAAHRRLVEEMAVRTTSTRSAR